MKNKNITTSLPVEVLHTITVAATELNIPKNEVITQAVTHWEKQRQQQKLAESYQRLSELERTKLADIADEDLRKWEQTFS